MMNNEQLIKNLTAKDEQKAQYAAQDIIDNTNTEAFKLLTSKSEFLFDFVKANVCKRLMKAIDKSNYNNLFAFLKLYSPDFVDVIIGSLAKYANEDMTDEMLELLENGSDDEKAYAAKYFSYIPDTIAADLLTEYSFCDNEAIAFNSAKALGAMNIDTAYVKAIDFLQSEDEFTVLKAVKFLVAYENKNAVKPILEAMVDSSMSENIAGEVPYIQSLLELLESDEEKSLVLLCIDNILAGLGEILPLNQIFCFELFEVLSYLIENNKQEKNSQTSVLLLKALSKFEVLTENDEYTFDEDKNTKQEISEIYNLLKTQQEYFWNAQKNLIKNELDETKLPAYRVINALRIISEFKLSHLDEEIKSLLKSTNEILLCEAVHALKQIGKLDDIDKNEILVKITDENKKALIQSLF